MNAQGRWNWKVKFKSGMVGYLTTLKGVRLSDVRTIWRLK